MNVKLLVIQCLLHSEDMEQLVIQGLLHSQILPAPGVKLQYPDYLGPKQQFMVMFMCILTVMLKVQL
jgi:hypothetical protein